jgi:hypothetical protein
MPFIDMVKVEQKRLELEAFWAGVYGREASHV